MSGDERTVLHQSRLFGVLCTYRRPAAAIRYLDCLERQTLTPEALVIVDNSDDRELRSHVLCRTSARTRYEYLAPGSNVGPAGAFKLGYDWISGLRQPGDLLVNFDDDDPPVKADLLERIVASLEREMALDPKVGGMGLSGGNLSPRSGLIRPLRQRGRLGESDHLHGGYLPVYRVDALCRVGGSDPTFWFGFEELELGRRLSLDGWRLLVECSLMAEIEHLYPKRSLQAGSGIGAEWGRFHKERNLIRILRRERRWTAIAFTALSRHIARPLFGLRKHPLAAMRRVVLGMRAVVAGLRDQGGIDPRYPPP